MTGSQASPAVTGTHMPVSLFYIHWPFCPFVALAGHDECMQDYHEVLCHEIKSYTDTHDTVPLKTVFFGGGTPSTYLPELLANTIDLLRDSCGFTTDYEQYEISSFAKKGRYAQHNSVYWQRKPYKGFGMGACSFDGEERSQNIKNLLKFIEEIRNTGKDILFTERLTDKQVWLEQLMLGLRQRRGIVVADILKPLLPQEKEEFSRKTQELLSAGLVSSSDDRMMLTPRGLSVANEVIVRLSCI